jgi:hypothetical protein
MLQQSIPRHWHFSTPEHEGLSIRLSRFTGEFDLSRLPGVNYVGGSRQLRRRVGAPTPLPWQGGGPRFCWGRLAGN